MKSIYLSIGLIFLTSLFLKAQHPTVSEEKYAPAWIERVNRLNLEFNLPVGFKIKENTYLQNATWYCKNRPYTVSRLVISNDGNIAIGLETISNSKWVTPKGDTIVRENDWVQNVKNSYSALGDAKKGFKSIDKQLLEGNWGGKYGIIMEPEDGICKPYLGTFKNSKMVIIASESWEVTIIYFYNDAGATIIDDTIKKTWTILQKKN